MKKTVGNVFIALIYILLYAPLLVMVFFSFNSAKSTSVFQGFSLKWYRELFSSSNTITALQNTLILAVTSALIATVIGTAAAVYIYYVKNKAWKNTLDMVTNIPMMNPDIVTGVSLMLLFVFVGRLLGLSNSLSFGTLLIAHVTFNLPYVILNVTPKFRQMDKHLPEAALDLGCTPVQSFFKVELPNVMPGIVTGFIMAFTLSLDDFVISYFCAGSDFQTLPILIYSMTKKEVKPDIYALSTLMIIAVLTLLILTNLTGDRDGKNSKNPDWRSHMRQRVQERRAHRTAGKGGDAK